MARTQPNSATNSYRVPVIVRIEIVDIGGHICSTNVSSIVSRALAEECEAMRSCCNVSHHLDELARARDSRPPLGIVLPADTAQTLDTPLSSPPSIMLALGSCGSHVLMHMYTGLHPPSFSKILISPPLGSISK